MYVSVAYVFVCVYIQAGGLPTRSFSVFERFEGAWRLCGDQSVCESWTLVCASRKNSDKVGVFAVAVATGRGGRLGKPFRFADRRISSNEHRKEAELD